MYFGIVRPIGVEIKHARRDIFILLIFSLQKLRSRFHYETLDRQDQAQVNKNLMISPSELRLAGV